MLAIPEFAVFAGRFVVTRHTVGGGSDSGQPQGLGAVDRHVLWTITEQVFEEKSNVQNSDWCSSA